MLQYTCNRKLSTLRAVGGRLALEQRVKRDADSESEPACGVVPGLLQPHDFRPYGLVDGEDAVALVGGRKHAGGASGVEEEGAVLDLALGDVRVPVENGIDVIEAV